MGVELYIGIASETKWNRHSIDTGGYSCISPMTGASQRTRKENRVLVPKGDKVIQDSGAFNDMERLSPQDVFRRQLSHAEKYQYADQITHTGSYDWLIDEKWSPEGKRYKQRWSESDARVAVKETVNAARWLSENRDGRSLVLSAQGVAASQYLACVESILPFMDIERDILGLGGWCIIGKQRRRMMPVFRETVQLVIPTIAESGVSWVHIWGVIFPDALGMLLWMCNQHDIKLSTDSAGPSWRPAFGDWGYGDWRDRSYVRPPVETRGLERARHVAATRAWLDKLEQTQYYRSP